MHNIYTIFKKFKKNINLLFFHSHSLGLFRLAMKSRIFPVLLLILLIQFLNPFLFEMLMFLSLVFQLQLLVTNMFVCTSI